MDPGHGGADPGAIGPTSLREADLNLTTSLFLQQFLELHGADVFMTRTTDATVSLSSRSNFFNSNNLDRAISVHHNSFTSPAPNYTLVFVYLGRCRATAGDLAEACARQLAHSTGLNFGASVCSRPGVTEMNFHMVREPTMPSILTEISFISNPAEEMRLRDSGYLRHNAWSIYSGVAEHYEVKPLPPQEGPVLTFDSSTYCVGDNWILKITNARADASIRLLGQSNGIAWEFPGWGMTDSAGNFSTGGTFHEGAPGSHSVRAEVDGIFSNSARFMVHPCVPDFPHVLGLAKVTPYLTVGLLPHR